MLKHTHASLPGVSSVVTHCIGTLERWPSPVRMTVKETCVVRWTAEKLLTLSFALSRLRM